jgi:O-antigen chain-terminating methyltransferase
VSNYHQFTPDADVIAGRMLTHQRQSAPAHDVHAGASSAADLPAVLPTTLDGITALHGSTFVAAAYRLLLGRDADAAGFDALVTGLRSGALDKVDVLGDLRWSDEGRHRAVVIPGLAWRYRLRRLGRIAGVGWAFRWLTTLGRLPALARIVQRHQVAAEEHAAAIQEVSAELTVARARIRTLESRIQTADGALAELFAALSDVTARVGAAEKSFDTRHQHLAEANARLLRQLHELRSAPSAIPARAAAPAASTADSRSKPADDLDDWYLAFEDQFRGTRDEIKRGQEHYLGIVTTAGAGTVEAPILDIGCGRGEWLELLQEHGCIASGIDLNEAMVRDNRDRGLDVRCGDAISHLAGLADASLGMVTGFHIIEHIRFDLLVRLFDECRRVLRPGGCILFETPNPENLVVGAYTFYFDPTHRHPLPPQMIEFVVRARGYAEVDILRLHPRTEEGADQALLDKWFRAPTDYAVVGWKDRRGAERDQT